MILHMSSLYEDELNRLIKEEKAQIRVLKKQGTKSAKVETLQADIKFLETELKHFQSALERFRAKPVQPTSSQNASSSQAS